MKKTQDILTSPEIVLRTKRILGLQKEQKKVTERLGRIVADIGDHLIAVKKKLDEGGDKTAWLRWLKRHIHTSEDTAQRHMRVAAMVKKNRNVAVFLRTVDISCLYRIASLPDHHVRKLKPATRLTDPKTGETKPIRDMSARELDRALDSLEGKRNGGEKLIDTHRRPAALDEEPVIGATREQFAAAARRAIDRLTRQVPGEAVRKLSGQLKPESKQAALKSVEALRRAVLGWPSWAATPKKRPATGTSAR